MMPVPFAPVMLYRNLGNTDMEGLNFILLKKRKSCFGGNKNRPGTKAGCTPRATIRRRLRRPL